MNIFQNFIKKRYRWFMISLIAIILYMILLDKIKIKENAINFILFFILIPVVVSGIAIVIEKRVNNRRKK
ncbi:hypothetical protein ACQ33O_01635 [Ferruginibacter sp. SUN002]|uniref:hypothetical protein n=1 Tax=Ferruginibacter sp. SUN002 TaxID=2937789 RepID=UPI003D369433